MQSLKGCMWLKNSFAVVTFYLSVFVIALYVVSFSQTKPTLQRQGRVAQRIKDLVEERRLPDVLLIDLSEEESKTVNFFQLCRRILVMFLCVKLSFSLCMLKTFARFCFCEWQTVMNVSDHIILLILPKIKSSACLMNLDKSGRHLLTVFGVSVQGFVRFQN